MSAPAILRAGSIAVTLALTALAGTAGSARAAVLAVPGAHPTVQAAIDAAGPGDTVEVGPGTYYENLDFGGKAITVTSTDGPATTILDGGMVGPVVKFHTGEGPASVLSGFTVTRGFSLDLDNSLEESRGAGVSIDGASPTIDGNVFVDNFGGHAFGGAVGFQNGSPTITDNTVSGGLAAGAAIGGFLGSPTVIGNVVQDHEGALTGGGIFCGACSAPTIVANTVRRNRIFQGGGIGLLATSGGTVGSNVVVDNVGELAGGGIFLQSCTGVVVANNTVARNRSANGGGVFLMRSTVTFVNNVLWENVATVAGGGGTCFEDAGSTLDVNDWRSNVPDALLGCSPGPGALDVDPGFVFPVGGDYHLGAGSALIDSGTDALGPLPAVDVDGEARVQDGAPPPGAVVDVGADERPG